MLTSQSAQCETRRTEGPGQPSLEELRRHLTARVPLSDSNRQRLLELAERVARVRALGGEYVRVGLSGRAMAALPGAAALA